MFLENLNIIQPENSEQLVNFRVALEERLLVSHFSKNAGNGPDVNWTRISAGAKQNFRRPVPQSHHLNHFKVNSILI